jgi:hypothetical protein
LRFGDDLVDGALEVLAARRVGDGGVEAEFHGATEVFTLPRCQVVLAHAPW